MLLARNVFRKCYIWMFIAFFSFATSALSDWQGAAAIFAGANDSPTLKARDGVSELPSVFGSVAIPVRRTVHTPRWAHILAEKERLSNAPCRSNVCDTEAYKRVRAAIDDSGSLSMLARAALLNSVINRAITPVADIRQYGLSDYWATAAETLKSGRGDCEDIAIVKMWALRSIGLSQEHLHLVLAVEKAKGGRSHALLVAKINGRDYVLDNLDDAVRPAAEVQRYAPLISFSADRNWLHGRKVPAQGIVLREHARAPGAS